MTSARELVRGATQRLHAAGIGPARHEAEWLLGRLVGIPPLELYLEDPAVAAVTVAQFASQVEARAEGIPLQYLVGEAEFFGEPFTVGPSVFIPRPETEAVVEAALQALRARQAQLTRALRIVDLGTGSGCIAVTLARALPTCLVVGIEVSWDALRVARHNVLRHDCARQVRLLQGAWLSPIRGRWDGLVANPPYVPSADVDRLPLDVRQEPRVSLDGGPDGLRAIEVLLRQVPEALAPGGILALECGETQVEPLRLQCAAAFWVQRVDPIQDLAGRFRGILAQRTL